MGRKEVQMTLPSFLYPTHSYITICVAIWETDEWPEEWMFSTFIPLPKKGDLKQNNFSGFPCKQDSSSDHTGKDPSEDRNRNADEQAGG